jgi:hypothetical protein
MAGSRAGKDRNWGSRGKARMLPWTVRAMGLLPLGWLALDYARS